MTKEEIAELRGKGLLDSDQLWDAVDTLLDEREALLEACRVAAADHANSWQTKEAARAAIAKAETE